MSIPIIDLFAGPGGLGEGFSAFELCTGLRPFSVRLSIEKEEIPHRTLELRAFFRQFPPREAPEDYYRYLRGESTREALFEAHPKEAAKAKREAWCATLGKAPHDEVMRRIRETMRPHCERWVLIGGPPCQAYSLAGRSRMKNDEAFLTDHRHFLYKEYLRIIADRRPAVFVMENVQGILSSQVKGKRIFGQIVRDLRQPRAALNMMEADGLQYRIYPLNGDGEANGNLFDEELPDASTFVVRADRYGIPQTRPRVFFLGVRGDLARHPLRLRAVGDETTVGQAIGDLPNLRSQISRGGDSASLWRDHLRDLCEQTWFRGPEVAPRVRERLCALSARVTATRSTGGNWLPQRANPTFERDWFHDDRLAGICNHEARGHMLSDLWRYFFAAVFAEVNGRSPLLRDFPSALRPAHQNVHDAIRDNDLFSDRFRVQLSTRPSTTVVSHISKDGHYYVHPDPLQCRSLTVREAARLQTFPDNYFFEGPRTAQYHQVGNAVPPLLARQIAEVVYEVLH